MANQLDGPSAWPIVGNGHKLMCDPEGENESIKLGDGSWSADMIWFLWMVAGWIVLLIKTRIKTNCIRCEMLKDASQKVKIIIIIVSNFFS